MKLEYDEFGMTPLHWAAKEGEKEEIDSLLQDGCDKNWRIQKTEVTPFGEECKVGDTPLIVAVRYGHSEVVAMLLTKWEADTTLQDSEGNTALHIAIAKSNIKNTDALLKAQASVKIENVEGITPPMMFSFDKGEANGSWMSHYITWLLENYRHVVPPELTAAALYFFIYRSKIKEIEAILKNRKDFANITSAFFIEGTFERFSSFAMNNRKFIALLGYGWAPTPLHIAATQASPEVIDLLLRYGANVDAANNQGERPLHYAARFGQHANARMLITNSQHIVDRLNRVNELTRNTALHTAVISADPEHVYYFDRLFSYQSYPTSKEDYLETVRVLVEAGARRDIINKEGRTAKDEATIRYCSEDNSYFEQLSEILMSEPKITLTPAPVYAPTFLAHQAAFTEPPVSSLRVENAEEDITHYCRCVVL